MVVLNQLEHLQERVGYDIARLKYHSVETYIKLSKHSQLYIFPHTINLGLKMFQCLNLKLYHIL